MPASCPFIVAIPARFDATRLPGKPLCILGDKPLIAHVAERACASGAQEVWVATDDPRIAQVLQYLPQIKIAMTQKTHLSGTDRLAECAKLAQWSAETCVVNLQGDEPFTPPEAIQQVAQLLHRSQADMATLASPIHTGDTVFDPNVVKLVHNTHGDVMYFSRAPMPWQRDCFPNTRSSISGGAWLRHIGIYAYTVGFLHTFTAMPSSTLERLESLEQLRALEAGYRIAVEKANTHFSPGIDTLDDLIAAQKHLKAK